MILCGIEWLFLSNALRQPIIPVFKAKKCKNSWPLVGPVGFPEKSVINCHSVLRNIPKERRYYLDIGGSLKSLICNNGLRAAE